MGDRVERGSGRVLGTEHCVAVPREGEKMRERMVSGARSWSLGAGPVHAESVRAGSELVDHP